MLTLERDLEWKFNLQTTLTANRHNVHDRCHFNNVLMHFSV